MRLLVTGAAGFLGSHLVDRLLAEGHDVVGVDDLSSGRLANLSDAREVGLSRRGAFSFVRTDLTSGTLGHVVASAEAEVVCHLAAVPHGLAQADPVRDAAVTVTGTVALLEACVATGVRKVVFASHAAIYGSPKAQPIGERAKSAPLAPWAAAKAAVEPYLARYRAAHGLDHTTLVVANAYGPRQTPDNGVVAAFATSLLGGMPTRLLGDGSQQRDFVYVDDAVHAFVLACGDVAGGRRLNVGTGTGTSVRALHTLVAKACAVPDAPLEAEGRADDLASVVLDPSAARQVGWEPWTDLASGVRQTVSWLRLSHR